MANKYTIPITRPLMDTEEEQAVVQSIRSGWITQGPKVREFENILAEYVGARYAVAVTSCTTALHLALVVSGVQPGDEVIVPSLSFIATANSVVHAGAVPVFVDIDHETCNIDPDKIESAITAKTKAVMPVHQVGLAADIDAIRIIAKKNNLRIIEDAACAIGSEYKGKRIGGHGNIACFSFHPRKVISTGEGGMITTDDPDISSRLRMLRHHGMTVSDLERHRADDIVIEEYYEIGYNYRMTDIQAAMGMVQMKRLPGIISKRRGLAERYNMALSAVPGIRVPSVPGYAFHNYQSYWIEVTDSAGISRDELMRRFLKRGIATKRGVMAIHLERPYKAFAASLPVTERITKNTVILPLYPSMTFDEQDYVIETMRDILKRPMRNYNRT